MTAFQIPEYPSVPVEAFGLSGSHPAHHDPTHTLETSWLANGPPHSHGVSLRQNTSTQILDLNSI